MKAEEKKLEEWVKVNVWMREWKVCIPEKVGFRLITFNMN